MSALTVRLKRLHPELGQAIPWPTHMSSHAAGLDIAAALDTTVGLEAGMRLLVPCGFAMAVPVGYEAQIRPRSGLALKHGVTVLNSPGTIDADYRGEVKVLLVNLGHEPFKITPGMRIAQMVIAAVSPVAIQVVADLDETDRGAGGFGSSGA